MSLRSEEKRKESLHKRTGAKQRKIARQQKKRSSAKKPSLLLRIFSKAKISWGHLLAILGTVALLTGLEYAYRPLLKIEGGKVLSAERPFDNPFTITNTSRYSIYNLGYESEFDDETINTNNFKDVGFSGTPNEIKELKPNQASTIKLNKLFNPHVVKDAKFKVTVRTNYSLPIWLKWVPWYKENVTHYFEVAQTDEGKYVWLEIAK